MGRFPIEGLTELTEDDLETAGMTQNDIRANVGLEPIDDPKATEMKPGVSISSREPWSLRISLIMMARSIGSACR